MAEDLPSIHALLAEVRDGIDQTRKELRETRAQSFQVDARLAKNEQAVKGVKDKLPYLVSRRIFIVAIVAFVGVIALTIGLGLKFRADDRAQRERDRAAATMEAVRKRDELVRGCQRGNDQRDTLRQVIEVAYEPSPIPAGISAELRALLVQSQERAAARRDELLSLPGVQPVDCEKAYPPPDGP